MYPLTLTAPSLDLETLAANSSTIFNMITRADMDSRDEDGNYIDDNPNPYRSPCLDDSGKPLEYM